MTASTRRLNTQQTSEQTAKKRVYTTGHRYIKTKPPHHIREADAALDGAIVVVGSHESGGNDAGRREKFPHAIGGVRVVVAEFPRLFARVVADDYQTERPFGLAR